MLRTAGLLLELFHFDLPGAVLAKLETFERGVSEYDMTSGETVADNMRIWVVMNRMTDLQIGDAHTSSCPLCK